MSEPEQVFLEKLVPVLATIVGGLLTGLGGFLLQSLTRKAEKRALHREKLESIYRISSEVANWTEDHVRDVKNASTGKIKAQLTDKCSPMHELIMMVRLYEPQLRNFAKCLENEVDAFQSEKDKFWIARNKGRSIGDTRSAVTSSFKNVSEARENLVRAIEGLMSKYI